MNQLPTEIFNEIFRYLHQEHKVECMLVCRYWKNTIEDFTLFHTVRIANLNNLEKTIQKLQENASYRNQVERLSLPNCKPNTNLTQIFLLLPNLRSLYLYNCNSKLLIDDGVTFPFANSIKKIVENSKDSIMRSLLSTSRCENLTSLAITDFLFSDITMLAHTPALTKLTLDLVSIRFEDIEFLHEKLPLLQTIKLLSMDVENYRYWGEIKPAPLVTECLFQYLEFTGETERHFLGYIAKKYPNMSNFTYVNDIDMNEGDDEILNTQGWKPFFKVLGPKLESVSIRQERGLMGVVQIMDDSGCELKKLTLSSKTLGSEVEKMGKSNQARYVESLTLEDIKFTNFEWLEEFKALRELSFISTHSDEPLVMELSDVLDACPPSLKSLSLQNVVLSVDLTKAQPYGIEKLSMEIVTFSEGLDTFISKFLPQISRLELMRCKLGGRTFNIMTSHLSHLTIAEDFSPETEAILLFTLSDNQKRWYNAERNGIHIAFHNDTSEDDIALYPAFHSLPANDIDVLPFSTILCGSVKNILISNYPFSI